MLLLLIVIGAVAGLLGGLLGISGGIITVPALVYLFKYYGFPSVNLLQLAIGTSLAAMVFNTIGSMIGHHVVKGAIQWSVVKKMLPGLVLGCLVGAYFAHIVPSSILELIFGLFAIILGVNFYRYQGLHRLGPDKIPLSSHLNGLGFGVGAISNILGIGGGTMTVPLFVRLKVNLKSAVATSTVTGFIITLIGAVAYLILGLGETYYESTLGFIYLPAFYILAPATCIFAPLGAKLSHKMNTDHLKKVFAICLMVVGALMVLKI